MRKLRSLWGNRYRYAAYALPVLVLLSPGMPGGPLSRCSG